MPKLDGHLNGKGKIDGVPEHKLQTKGGGRTPREAKKKNLIKMGENRPNCYRPWGSKGEAQRGDGTKIKRLQTVSQLRLVGGSGSGETFEDGGLFDRA